MNTLRKAITGIMLAALLAIGGLGFSAQSEAVEFTQEVQAVQLDDDCICADYRNCGTFFCSCEGPTNSQCEGDCSGCGPEDPIEN